MFPNKPLFITLLLLSFISLNAQFRPYIYTDIDQVSIKLNKKDTAYGGHIIKPLNCIEDQLYSIKIQANTLQFYKTDIEKNKSNIILEYGTPTPNYTFSQYISAKDSSCTFLCYSKVGTVVYTYNFVKNVMDTTDYSVVFTDYNRITGTKDKAYGLISYGRDSITLGLLSISKGKFIKKKSFPVGGAQFNDVSYCKLHSLGEKYVAVMDYYNYKFSIIDSNLNKIHDWDRVKPQWIEGPFNEEKYQDIDSIKVYYTRNSFIENLRFISADTLIISEYRPTIRGTMYYMDKWAVNDLELNYKNLNEVWLASRYWADWNRSNYGVGHYMGDYSFFNNKYFYICSIFDLDQEEQDWKNVWKIPRKLHRKGAYRFYKNKKLHIQVIKHNGYD
jgi:hypothetical protein